MRRVAVMAALVALGGCASAGPASLHHAAPQLTLPVATMTTTSTTPATLPVPVGNVAAPDPGMHSAPHAAEAAAGAFAQCWFDYNWRTDQGGHARCRASATPALAANWDTVAADPSAAGRHGRHETDRAALTSVVAEDVTPAAIGFSVTVSIDATADGQAATTSAGYLQLRLVAAAGAWRVDQVTLP